MTFNNRADSSVLTDDRQKFYIPTMNHDPAVYGDKVFCEIKTSASSLDGCDAGTSTLEFPVRIKVEGTNYIENRMLTGAGDFSLSDISSGTLENDKWIEAWSYSINAGESLKFGFQNSLAQNSRAYINLSDDTGS